MRLSETELLDALADAYIAGAKGVCEAFGAAVEIIREEEPEKFERHREGLETAGKILDKSAVAFEAPEIKEQIVGKMATVLAK